MTGKPGLSLSKIDRHPGFAARRQRGCPKDLPVQWGLMAACTRSGARATILCSLLSRDGGKTFSRARSVIHTAPIMFAVDTLERGERLSADCNRSGKPAPLRDLDRLS